VSATHIGVLMGAIKRQGIGLGIAVTVVSAIVIYTTLLNSIYHSCGTVVLLVTRIMVEKLDFTE